MIATVVHSWIIVAMRRYMQFFAMFIPSGGACLAPFAVARNARKLDT